jgi:hypothetical protein
MAERFNGSAFAKMLQDCGVLMANVFEEKHNFKEKRMTFGEALAACKDGARIAREGWNGKDQFVYYQSGSVISVDQIRNAALREWAREQDLPDVEMWGHFDFKPTNNKIQCGWLASQADMQADDWEILPPGEALGERIEADLTLPIANIGGLRFNEQKVHAVFEKQDDGWWQSKDILFLSARNAEDDNSRDILTEYLNDDRIKQQIGDLFSLPPEGVAVTLPRETQGTKQYHGVDCWYWLAPARSSPAARFCYVNNTGNATHTHASAVGGCSPAFRVAERHS